MICPNCGKEIEDGSVFCRFCGTRMEETGEKPAVQETLAENAPQRPEAVIPPTPAAVPVYPAETTSAAASFEPAKETKAPSKAGKVLSLIGRILSIVGCAGFLTIVLVGLIVYQRVYLYDGYEFTKILCSLCIILMLAGTILMFIGLLIDKTKRAGGVVFSIILMVLSLAGSAFLITKAVESMPKSSYRSSSSSSSYRSSSSSSSRSSSSSSSSYQMDHSTYCLLYMKVSNVNTKRSGDWVYCTGTVKNTGSYSVKYVKVRAGFKDSRGNVIDTDWTYAVGSEWLNPGESKNFEMMVKDSDRKIKSADVIILTN